MAFNPFAGFAKYRKLWLAAVMILVMITFVLCTGKGDMSDKLLQWFRFGGTAVASIGGRTYYRQDFDMLAKQRKAANDFMNTYARLLIDLCSDRLRVPLDPKDEEAAETRQRYAFIRQVLTFRTKDPNFFDNSFKPATKIDELIDFRVWLTEADRLGINLPTDKLFSMIEAELFQDKIPRGENILALHNKAMDEVLRSREFNAELVLRGIENEFRVRIARLADDEYQTRSLGDQQHYNSFKRVKPDQFNPPLQVRLPLSLDQVWDFYQENRREFDVALMAMPVSAFAADVPEPDKKKLEEFFEKYKTAAFDPSSDQPGFRKPQQFRIQYVSADKNSPFFKRIAQTSRLLAEAPIGSFVPQFPLATALTFAAGSGMTDELLDLNYKFKLRNEQNARFDLVGNFVLSDDPASGTAVFLARRNPLAVASMVGTSLRLDGGIAGTADILAWGYDGTAAILDEARKEEIREIVPMDATLVASATMPGGLQTAAELFLLNRYFIRPLPLAAVRPDILKELDERLANRYVTANMAFIKKKLEDDIVTGKALQVQRLLERYGPRKEGQPSAEGEFRDLGLEIAQTKDFYDRYHIKDAPELKPLLESFQRYYPMVNMTEGRDARPEAVLKDDDFWKLFFDPAESFSAAHGKYHAKPWPPVIKLGKPAQIETLKPSMAGLETNAEVLGDIIRQSQNREPNKDVAFNLFTTSDRPFLFWRTEEKQSEVPEKLADVEPQVVQAWKMQQARDTKVLPFARKLAEGLQTGNAEYDAVIKTDPKFGDSIIRLERLAPLYTEDPSGLGRYADFKLKRGVISYPRDDMVAQLLSLKDLQKPVETGNTDLDRLNADLFRDAESKKLKRDKIVQILTNKPRDTFYVAVVTKNLGPHMMTFYRGVLPGAGTFRDTLLDRANEKLGEQHARAMMRQLRKDHNVSVFDAAKTMFDSEGGQ